LNSLVTYRSIQPELIATIAARLLDNGSDSSSSEETIEASKALLTTLVERHPAQVDQARLARISAGKETADSLVDQDTSSMAFVNAYSADAAARIRSIPPLLRAMGMSAGDDEDIEIEENEDRQSAVEKILILLGDDDKTVTEALYKHVEQTSAKFLEVLQPATYIATIAPVFDTVKPVPAIRSQHLAFISSLDQSSFSKDDSVNMFMTLVFPSLLATANRPCFSQTEWSILEKGLFANHDLTSSNEFKKAISQAKSANTSDKVEGTALNPILMNAVAGMCHNLCEESDADDQHQSSPPRLLTDTKLLLSNIFRAMFQPRRSRRISLSADS